jgi:S-adenosylmethionine:tRNA ribosyltransferase-isomerase
MKRSDFHFDLPPDLIAQHPLARRGASRLLCLDGPTGEVVDRRFADLPDLLRPGDLLVFNDTRVMRARLFGRKETGGQVEILVERLLGPDVVLAQVRASKSPKPDGQLVLASGEILECLGREGEFFRLRTRDGDFPGLMERHGHMPLPPYIQPPTRPRTRSAIRRSTPVAWGRWRRPPPGCTSMLTCWRDWRSWVSIPPM